MRTVRLVEPDPPAAARAAARRLVRVGREAVEARGRFALAISGGSTPLPLFRRLATLSADGIPWRSTHVFWADERAVLPDSSDSNYGTARAALLNSVAIPDGQVHRIPAELRPLSQVAAGYAAELDAFFGGPGRPRDAPTFDVVVLGLGLDGHTASLFPGSPELNERERSVVEVPLAGQPPKVPRVSLTLPAISRARTVVFLVTGAEKRPILARLFPRAGAAPSGLPAARVRAVEEVDWIVDAAAAGRSTGFGLHPSAAGPRGAG